MNKRKPHTLSQQSSDTEDAELHQTYSWEEEDQFHNLQNSKKLYRACKCASKLLNILEKQLIQAHLKQLQ